MEDVYALPGTIIVQDEVVLDDLHSYVGQADDIELDIGLPLLLKGHVVLLGDLAMIHRGLAEEGRYLEGLAGLLQRAVSP